MLPRSSPRHTPAAKCKTVVPGSTGNNHTLESTHSWTTSQCCNKTHLACIGRCA